MTILHSLQGFLLASPFSSATAAGVSHDTIHKAKFLRDHADEPPVGSLLTQGAAGDLPQDACSTRSGTAYEGAAVLGFSP